MAGRRRDPSALLRAVARIAPSTRPAGSGFRAAPDVAPAARPSRRQALALLAVLALVCGVVAVLSYVIKPERARAFDLFHGSVFISDQLGPVAADLATGRPTLQLVNANNQVGITGSDILETVPLADHTLLLNSSSGEFNMVDNNGFIVKHNGSGVRLSHRKGPTTAAGIDAGSGQAYILRTGPLGGTDVYLVNQTTVEAAVTTKHPPPRASTKMTARGSTAPGGAASANGDLWLLVQASNDPEVRTIRQLTVPADSNAGASLITTDYGQVRGPAAIGTAGSDADGTGSSVVGVASISRIDVFAPGSKKYTATYAPPADVKAVLPVSNETTRLAFLMRGDAGWYLVSMNADGTDLRVPTLLTDIPATASLAAPAASWGNIYTIDQTTGVLYRIGYDGKAEPLPGRSRYPVATGFEHPDYADVSVFARGPRVIFNSPRMLDALMVFTDGRFAPRTISKRNAVQVDAAGGIESYTKSNVPEGQAKPPKPGAPKPRRTVTVQPVNPDLTCHTAAVKPHIPEITSAQAGSRSVTLGWRYPVLSPHDCIPSTYVIKVSLVGNDAPPPPGPIRVQAQTGYTVPGLFPSTEYLVTVTAYIQKEGTESAGYHVTTGPEGPPAPTNLSVAADSDGNWHLVWDSCGTAEQGCVPAQSWTITPTFCDHRGISAPPAPMTATADPTARQQPEQVYTGNDDLLGRGLSFQVEGTGPDGTVGTPSNPSPCVYSWSTPIAADLAVQASTPPQTATSTDTTTTTARVTFANGRVHDLGGVGATLTYQLLAAGTVVDTVGPTTAASVKLSGVRAAVRYQVQVRASPPRHPEITVPIGPVDVVPAIAAWPAVQVDQPTFDAPPGLTGTLHVRFTFPDGTDTRGETFQLVNSQLVCGGGNAAMNLQAADVAPGDDLTFTVDRTTYRGPCTVTLQLAQDPRTVTDPPLYGAGTSAARTSPPVQIDPPSITSTAGDFQAQWSGTNGNPNVIVSYHGGDDLDGARNWQITLSRGSDTCGSATGAPPATIDVVKSCVAQGSGQFSVHIEYDYFLVSHAAFDVPVIGDAPQPIDPDKLSFTAEWNSNPDLPQVLIDYTGSEPPAALAALDWTEVVTSSANPGETCATDHDNPGNATVRISDVLAACPATPDADGQLPTYSVEISFTDPNYGRSGDYPTPVDGTPPQ